MKRSKVNNLLVDDSRTPFKDCDVIDQCDDGEPNVPDVTGLRFEPATDVTGVPGPGPTVQLIASYSFGPDQVVTNPPSLVVSDPLVFSYAHVADNPNVVLTLLAEGTATLTATLDGQTAVLNVAVTAA